MVKSKWELFEKFINKVLKDLASDVLVRRNQYLIGKRTKKHRKIDLLIQRQVGHSWINIAIEYQDLKNPMDVTSIKKTIELFQDVAVNMGIIVAANGFTREARAVGENAKLKLYDLADTDNHNWNISLEVPTLCYVQNLEKFNFSIEYPSNKLVPIEDSYMLYNQQGEQLGFVRDLIAAWWTQTDHGFAAGYHKNIDCIPEEKFILVNKELIQVKIKANVHVEEFIYLKEWLIEEISEFEERTNDKIKTKNFMTEDIDLEDLKNNCGKIKDVSSLAIKPFFRTAIKACNNF
jgi:hypothetical protein